MNVRRSLRLGTEVWTGLDSKKDVHLDGSPVGPVSRLEVFEGPSGRRVRSDVIRHAKFALTHFLVQLRLFRADQSGLKQIEFSRDRTFDV